MAQQHVPIHRRCLTAAAATLVLTIAACTAGDTGDGNGGTSPAAGPASPTTVAGAPAVAGNVLPGEHVHALSRNPADGDVYLATHEGLYRMAPGAAPARVGPVIDLMGFTVAGPNHFYASGHPGENTDLPDPVGLIESTDGGRSWVPLSRQGRSDFHTLATSSAGIVGYDGETLAVTSDGRTWQTLTAPVTPHAAAAFPDGATVLLTSPSGLARSSDGGRTWTQIATPILPQLTAFADTRHAAAVSPDGRVATSNDAGATWQTRGSIEGEPHAISAAATPSGAEILAVGENRLQRSVDDGATFTPYQP
ncbi:F510_1955 family glycosylhydrolase [Krasilnikovia cinnamomea]|nr:sialidase family protein [Krasilnikovia cinnamomea]